MPTIVHRIGIAAEPMRVFEALTTTAGICGWWNSQTQGDAAEGGAFQFRSNRLEALHADPFMHHCSTKWATFLLSLKDLVERGEGRPEPDKDTKIAVDA